MVWVIERGHMHVGHNEYLLTYPRAKLSWYVMGKKIHVGGGGRGRENTYCKSPSWLLKISIKDPNFGMLCIRCHHLDLRSFRFNCSINGDISFSWEDNLQCKALGEISKCIWRTPYTYDKSIPPRKEERSYAYL